MVIYQLTWLIQAPDKFCHAITRFYEEQPPDIDDLIENVVPENHLLKIGLYVHAGDIMGSTTTIVNYLESRVDTPGIYQDIKDLLSRSIANVLLMNAHNIKIMNGLLPEYTIRQLASKNCCIASSSSFSLFSRCLQLLIRFISHSEQNPERLQWSLAVYLTIIVNACLKNLHPKVCDMIPSMAIQVSEALLRKGDFIKS